MALRPSRNGNEARPKKLEDIKNEFERGVFLVLYRSRKQRWHRSVALVFLSLKHVFRGVMFSWPLYMLASAALFLPAELGFVFLILLAPAVYLSWKILHEGVREDYRNLIEGYILRSGYLGRILFHGSP